MSALQGASTSSGEKTPRARRPSWRPSTTSPRPKAIGDVSQEEADRMEAIRRVYDRYQNSLEIARSLSVPILTQSVFMNFLGY